MSKRFGRNQKRKSKTHIAALKSDNASLKHNINKIKDKLEYLEHVISNLGRIIDHSAVLRPKHISGDPRHRIHRISSMSIYDVYTKYDMSSPIPIETQDIIIDLQKIEVMVRKGEMENPFSIYVHAYVGDKTGVAYYISEEALSLFGPDMDYLSSSIAHKLSVFMMKKGR